ncbi:MAG: hypothetical protein AAGU75_11940, partial [Bacillota bacterium]
HSGDLASLLTRIHYDPPFTLERINPNILAFRLSKQKDKNNEPDVGVIAIMNGSHSCLFRVISISRGGFWVKVVIPFLKRNYPHLSILYFKQSELEESLLGYEKRLNIQFADKAKVRVIEVTRKAEQSSRLNQKIKFRSTERSWTNLSLAETFADLKERGFWFTNLKFKVLIASPSRERLNQRSIGKVSKFGSFSCTSMYHELRSLLIEPLEIIASERMHLLEGRGIIERDYKPGPPLEIVFEDEVFDSTVKVRQFGETLGHFQDSSIVIYHGNPYFHANIADQRDGSSFEIWVLSQKRILITPQAKASAQALSRVITFIFDRFKEGMVSEYAPGTD